MSGLLSGFSSNIVRRVVIRDFRSIRGDLNDLESKMDRLLEELKDLKKDKSKDKDKDKDDDEEKEDRVSL